MPIIRMNEEAYKTVNYMKMFAGESLANILGSVRHIFKIKHNDLKSLEDIFLDYSKTHNLKDGDTLLPLLYEDLKNVVTGNPYKYHIKETGDDVCVILGYVPSDLQYVDFPYLFLVRIL
jgi:hypothetical protein